jgi:hypothetical protein
VSNGVAVSIGPIHGGEHDIVRHWMTFPVTPSSIPIAGDANYLDGLFNVAGDERASFAGRTLETVQFSGELEPPRVYYPTREREDYLEAIGAGRWIPDQGGDHLAYSQDEDQAAYVLAFRRSRSVSTIGRGQIMVPHNLGGTSVVVRDGAHAGPAAFVEPHIFTSVLTGIRDTGERVRLVIGDQYGWNGIVTCRSFAWRYEDPDPDVLYYDVTFREDARRTLHRVKTPKSAPGKQRGTYTTKSGDTLHEIALKQLGDQSKWKHIRDLNDDKLGRLWFYPDPNHKHKGTLGPKVQGRKNGYQLGKKGVAKLGGNVELRAGIELKLRETKDGHDKKSKGGHHGNRDTKTGSVGGSS